MNVVNASAPVDQSQRLLEIVRVLAHELRPQATHTRPLGLSDSLERDYGLDSLARVELIARVEREFSIRLPEEVFAEIETPQDLMPHLKASHAVATVVQRLPEFVPSPADHPGESVTTLVEALEWHSARHPDRVHIMLYAEHEIATPLTYGHLRNRAREVAAGLRAHKVGRGEAVAIMLPTGADFFAAFYGALYAQAVPVPVYPPARAAQLEEHMRRIAGILSNANAQVLITMAYAKPLARLLRVLDTPIRLVTTAGEIALRGEGLAPPVLVGSDTAFLQYTSGSTGQPKGVVLSHANLLANLHAMAEATQVTSKDVFVSWLPLYHDMGLIGACLGTMLYAFPLVLMSPFAFLGRPIRWLSMIQRHRATITAGPNFAYELCVNKIDDAALPGLDLSSLRLAFNGAEAVSPATLDRFCTRFAGYGFKREAMTPVYGLAECSVGLAFPPLQRGPRIDSVERTGLQRYGLAKLAHPNDSSPLHLVSCGSPLRAHAIRIVDDSSRELPERVQGHIQFRGPSATAGYFHNPAETKKLFDGEWLRSGDLGYLAEGELYITGRAKDIIIRGGQNIHPQELEDAVAGLAGVRKGGVAVFPVTDNRSGTERLIVLAETRLSEPRARAELEAAINHLAVDLIAMPADEIVLAPPRTVLKTSSGKIRRAACRALYERGEISARTRSAWWQVTRLISSGMASSLLRRGYRLLELAWGVWTIVLVAIFAPVTWLLVMLLPTLTMRRQAVHHAARLFFACCAAPIHVNGRENLPGQGPLVLVANHSSYLDALVLTAALPARIAFVAKRELAEAFPLGMALKRIGSVFVERIDPAQGVVDTAQLEQHLRAGGWLVAFPEGTFRRAAGLLPFHMGAFISAAQTATTVIPVAIHGTRSILPDGARLPRRGSITLSIGLAYQPTGTNWAAALQLRDQTRFWIEATLSE